MIKNFQSFNENSIYFSDSKEFKDLKTKIAIKNEEIFDYFTDLTDDGFKIEIKTQISEHTGTLRYVLLFTTIISNPSWDHATDKSKMAINSDVYQSHLKNQIDNIDLVKRCCNRFAISENLTDIQIDINHIPFTGSGNNLKPSIEFRIRAILDSVDNYQDDIKIAKNSFNNSPNPLKSALDKLIVRLKKEGIPNPEKYIDTLEVNEENPVIPGVPYEVVDFGVVSDNEIFRVATYQNGHLYVYDD